MAWKTVLLACYVKVTGLGNVDQFNLTQAQDTALKRFNILLLSMAVTIGGLYSFKLGKRSLLAWFLFLCCTLVCLSNAPRMINRLNNDNLALLLLLLSSWAVTRFVEKPQLPRTIFFGILMGLLALSKSQCLYLWPALGIFLYKSDLRQVLLASVICLLVLAPWLLRNISTFGKASISERGLTVLSVRCKLTADLRDEEYKYMFFAFTHPDLRPSLGSLLGVDSSDFVRHKPGERLRREWGYDMGTELIRAGMYPEDAEAYRTQDPSKAVQIFHSAYIEGLEAERGRFNLNVYMTLSSLWKYIGTFPLFLWRGLWFTGVWLLGPAMFLALGLSLFNPDLRPFSFLACLLSLFHICLTHNIPRYQILGAPVMAICLACLLANWFKLAWDFVLIRLRKHAPES